MFSQKKAFLYFLKRKIFIYFPKCNPALFRNKRSPPPQENVLYFKKQKP